MRAIQFAILLYAIALIVGCDSRSERSSSIATSAPSTEAADKEDTDPAAELLKSSTSRPAIAASMRIDGREYDFPPVQLLLSSSADGLTALLVSDDAAEPSDPEYAGNSVYLNMILTVPEGKTLQGAKWDYQATSSQREDEINGIYLNGQRRALQPFVGQGEILGDISPVKIRLSGMFLLFDEQSEQGRAVEVSADLIAKVKVENRK